MAFIAENVTAEKSINANASGLHWFCLLTIASTHGLCKILISKTLLANFHFLDVSQLFLQANGRGVAFFIIF